MNVIQAARECGAEECFGNDLPECEDSYILTADQLRSLEADIRADQREKDARICDARVMGDNNREDEEAKRCAAAIREGKSNE